MVAENRAHFPVKETSTPTEDSTVCLLWVCPLSVSECGRGFAITKVDQRTPQTMLVILAVVVVSVLLLLLLLVLV